MAKLVENNQPVLGLHQQAQCLQREVRMRYGVYPGRVAAGKMSQAEMDQEIGLMSAAVDTITHCAKNGAFRALYDAAAKARGYSREELLREIDLGQQRANEMATAGELAAAQAECLKLAGLTFRLSEVLGELLAKPQAGAPAVSAPVLERPAPSATAAKTDYASKQQKQQILLLLTHPAISQKEKTKVMLNINRLSIAAAEETAEHLQHLADVYDGPTTYAKAS